MPTKRTRTTRGRNILTLDSIDLHHHVQFASGWHPPGSEFQRERSRWTTYQEYLADWQQVRDACLSDPDAFCSPNRDGWHFAERMLDVFGPDGPPPLMSRGAICDALR